MKKTTLFIGLMILCLKGFTQETGIFTDSRDGRAYRTVKIGKQVWMAENLAYKPSNSKYWAYNNNQGNVEKYGYLYGWENANVVCPAGWHLPKDAEWTSLTNFLGGVSKAGGKMKAISGWQNPNTNATNESGFNAFPAGHLLATDSTFSDLGTIAFFWTNAPANSEIIWRRDIRFYTGEVFRDNYGSSGGYSIRCIKD